MAKKSFNELTEQGKANRIKKYEEQDAKYNQTSVLTRVTKIVDNGVKETKDGRMVHRFGYNMVEAGADAKELLGEKFVWGNQIVDVEKGGVVIEAVLDMKARLDTPEVKSLLTSMKIGNDTSQYINVNAVYERQTKKQKQAQQNAAADTELPY